MAWNLYHRKQAATAASILHEPVYLKMMSFPVTCQHDTMDDKAIMPDNLEADEASQGSNSAAHAITMLYQNGHIGFGGPLTRTPGEAE